MRRRGLRPSRALTGKGQGAFADPGLAAGSTLALGPETGIPDDPIGAEHLITYTHEAPPVFLGHYWLTGEPTLLAPNIACVDYSVGLRGGKLVAYRWDGERRLDATHFRQVERLEPDDGSLPDSPSS